MCASSLRCKHKAQSAKRKVEKACYAFEPKRALEHKECVGRLRKERWSGKIKREETPIAVKSKALALEIIKLSNFLKEKKHEYSLSDQMIRSGTSVGANVREAIHGVSDNDMYNKFNIALKEASETEYWLEILSESGYLSTEQIETAYGLCKECFKMLVSITAKQKKL